ncbi:MAG TPA: hypothetical protein VL588_12120, partial [Bdellovibrionota bacterium]|nr:hypothetical protein [Bdellovibrionota bacterium]
QLKTADYDWKIRTLIEGSVDAGPSKRWQSPDEGKYSFTVHRRNLEPPAALDPEGDVQVTTSSRQLFQWEPVQGAVAYLLKIRRMDDRGKDAFVRQILDRSPASAGLTESTGGDGGVETVVLGTHVELDLPHDGSYLWEVRGLASIQADDRAKYAGPGSEAKFEYEQEIMGGVQGSGYLALSTMLAPYTYSMISPESGFSGQAASTAVTMRVSAERIMTSKLGLGVAYETTFFQLSGASFTRGQAELVGKYKIELPGGQYPWVIQPNIGPQARQYFQLTPGGGGITNNRSFWTLGASVGIDVRKQLSKRFSLGARASLFVPLGLSGLQGDHHLTGTASFRNLSLGLQGVYWLGGSWGLAAGAYHDDRSISFNSTVPGAVDEQVYTDGSYFYGSVIYKF